MFGVSNDIGIGIAISLHDNFTMGLKSAALGFNEFKTSANQSAHASLRAARMAGMGLTRLGQGTYGFLSKSVSAYSDYEYVMKSVEAITKATADQMDNINKTSTKLALNTIFTSRQIASAFEEMALAGLTPREMVDMAPNISHLAAATNTDIRKSAEYVTDIMTAMGMQSNEAAHAVDLMVVATNNANMRFTQLYQTMKYIAYNGRLAKISLEELLSVTGAVANAGLKASIGGTTLNNFLIRLTMAVSKYRTSRQTSALEELGLGPEDVMDSAGQLRNLIDIFETLQTKLTGGALDIAAMQALFGRRGGRAVVIAQALGDPAIGKNARELFEMMTTNPSGYAKLIADAKMWGTHAGQLLALRSAQEEFRKSVGQTLIPVLTDLIKAGRSIVKVFHMLIQNPIGKVFVYALPILGAFFLLSGKILTTWVAIAFITGQITGNMGMFTRTLMRILPGIGLLFTRMTGLKATTGAGGKRRYRSAGAGGGMGGYVKTPPKVSLFGGLGRILKGSMLAKLASSIFGPMKFISGFVKKILGFGSGLAKSIPILGKVGGLLFRFLGFLTGPAGWILTIGSIVGWGRILRTLGMAFSTLGNILMFVVDSVAWVFGKSASPMQNFNRRQYEAHQRFSGPQRDYRSYEEMQRDQQIESERRFLDRVKKNEMRIQRLSNPPHWLENSQSNNIQNQNQPAPDPMRNKLANLNIYVDGQKKLEEMVQRGMDENIKIS